MSMSASRVNTGPALRTGDMHLEMPIGRLLPRLHYTSWQRRDGKIFSRLSNAEKLKSRAIVDWPSDCTAF